MTRTPAGELDNMTTQPRPLGALAFVEGLLRRVPEPRERLTAIRLVRAELVDADDALRPLLAFTIRELRDLGTQWSEIGNLLDVSAQRAHQLAEIGIP